MQHRLRSQPAKDFRSQPLSRDAPTADAGPAPVVRLAEQTRLLQRTGATKTAPASLTRGWTAEYSGRGVRLNTVAPGPLYTRPEARDLFDALAETTAMKRAAQPAEIAEAVAFLASPKAGYIAGATVAVDGGRTAIRTRLLRAENTHEQRTHSTRTGPPPRPGTVPWMPGAAQVNSWAWADSPLTPKRPSAISRVTARPLRPSAQKRHCPMCRCGIRSALCRHQRKVRFP
ncbi:SDR family NAD(P)-dependent oxidoreductase [Streptomyces sp. NPDC097727]|uniref:SDR family NAD(P)-dependent oxidoreductase n=1 Tax=Streptomyces sp. NPDC097727 TaxID=3366092 RepID=UPI003804CB60